MQIELIQITSNTGFWIQYILMSAVIAFVFIYFLIKPLVFGKSNMGYPKPNRTFDRVTEGKVTHASIVRTGGSIKNVTVQYSVDGQLYEANLNRNTTPTGNQLVDALAGPRLPILLGTFGGIAIEGKKVYVYYDAGMPGECFISQKERPELARF